MKWVTRSHVHVDRVACPWLVTRFIDSDAEFLFVPKSEVLKIAERARDEEEFILERLKMQARERARAKLRPLA